MNSFKKYLLFGVIVSIIVSIVLAVYNYKYQKAREYDAAVALFHGEDYFASQQWEIALIGDTLGYMGFLDIIDEFKGTKVANLALAYAGICQFQLKKYKQALYFFKNYRSKEKLFMAQIIGAMGDCEVNLGNIKSGIEYFKKAANKANNSYFSPFYLKKAAIACESLKNYRLAKDIYIAMRFLYPRSPWTVSVEKYIERANENF